ncbi:MAG: hypothetical protein ACI84K_000077 [Pseudohongiellaceae bacterium]|jgi:hypothetical protein
MEVVYAVYFVLYLFISILLRMSLKTYVDLSHKEGDSIIGFLTKTIFPITISFSAIIGIGAVVSNFGYHAFPEYLASIALYFVIIGALSLVYLFKNCKTEIHNT